MRNLIYSMTEVFLFPVLLLCTNISWSSSRSWKSTLSFRANRTPNSQGTFYSIDSIFTVGSRCTRGAYFILKVTIIGFIYEDFKPILFSQSSLYIFYNNGIYQESHQVQAIHPYHYVQVFHLNQALQVVHLAHQVLANLFTFQIFIAMLYSNAMQRVLVGLKRQLLLRYIFLLLYQVFHFLLWVLFLLVDQ